MQTVIITGGTGLVGKALTSQLIAKGFNVIIFSRKIPEKNNVHPQVEYALWDIYKKVIDIPSLQKADYIIHLAGAGVMEKRWTTAYKKEIQDSRIMSSELLVETLQQHTNRVKAVISASAIGFYGSDENLKERNGFVETDKAARGFLGETCQLWEKSIEPVEALGKRLVVLRTGIVLSQAGGALAEFEKPVKAGVAGILASGKQIVSWIHIDDLCQMYIDALQKEQMNGTYNAVAPEPVSNKRLTLELARQLKGKFFISMHVPAFALKLLLGEGSTEVLKSTTVNAEKIQQAGFRFSYPSIEKALKQLAGNL